MPLRVAVSCFAAVLSLPSPAAPPAVVKVPARYTSPASGPEMYEAYCAACHGAKGRGDGPAARSLKQAVPDLATLAKRHQGVFPKDQVAKVLLGETGTTGHGTEDMPEWRQVFRSLNHSQEPVVRMRAANLVRHIESLQAR